MRAFLLTIAMVLAGTAWIAAPALAQSSATATFPSAPVPASGGQSGDLIKLKNPLDRCPSNPDPSAFCHTNTVPGLIFNIVSTAVGIVGALALLVFIYGGFIWLTSGGDAGKIGKGKEAMKWAAIGLVVIFTSYALVRFVFSAITG